ncbi:heavy metal sensor histidine kinase [Paludibacterium purpuratum]|uniref:Sensor protein n=1 Tax=Paludibacterium purpuratum TaxID=1144873 RepID=A0A4R7B2A3_9NEIS|nr:heavy metal sensor histidine kinase [Paludibacterium purpuratum]TDR77836.1 two-component system heavy metal sensor histidine kinase CusS [Paludibacterium purpuratum]
MIASRRPSITLTLTLLFALVSSSVLFIIGLTLSPLVERHFESLDSARLDGVGRAVSFVFHSETTQPHSPSWAARLNEIVMGQNDIALAVFDAQARRIYASQGWSLPGQTVQTMRQNPEPLSKLSDAHGHAWHTRLFTVQTPQGAQTVILAVNLSAHQHFMASFRLALWVVIGIAALVSGMLGWWVTHRGLAPLRDIRRKTARINVGNLNYRLPDSDIPKELAGVVDALNVMLARLENAFQRLSDFSADIAHELRTPVNSLLTQNQVMLTKARSLESYQDVLAANVEELEHMSRIISDMLFLAKASNNMVIPNREPVSLHEEARQVLDFYDALIEESALTVDLDGQAQVSGDRLMLRRAIGNLVSNAVRYTNPGGTITIHISQSPDGTSHFSIRNTGPTIAPEHLARLFDRFYRAEPKKTEAQDGAGLGLAITKSILQAHQGDIQVRSGDGVTAFEFWLPA